jgi:hypothetical protein
MVIDARQLRDGLVGYCMEPGRADGCLQPAIATVLQVSPRLIPDPRIDERIAAGDSHAAIVSEYWTELDAWLADRGLQAVFHDVSAGFPDCERWVGVCRSPGFGELLDQMSKLPKRDVRRRIFAKVVEEYALAFNDHCVVMCRDAIFFDPAVGLRPPPGHRACPYRPSDIAYGISFDHQEVTA